MTHTSLPTDSAHDQGRRVRPLLFALVFVVGAGSLGAEIAAARLMAPYFGASTIVWANTIGVVLLALSVGYWLGGRLADRRPRLEALCGLALISAVLLAAVPFVADPLLDLSVDALDSIAVGAFIGSLLGVTLLVAIPVMLLGAVAPWAVRLAVTRVEDAGAVVGRLYAISTVGSLIGTFASALLLIPLIGTRRTFLTFALLIALVAVAGVGRRPLRWLAPAVIVALLALPAGAVKGRADGGRVVYESETPYQYARVVEGVDGRRTLELNEGQAVHSIFTPNGYLTDDVWDGPLVLPFLARTSAPGRIAILGNAAGTIARAYGHFFPATVIDGVEIDAELSAIGRRWFDMRNPRLTVHNVDARPYLRSTGNRYDVIAIDAYRQPYIPFYLTTREFFTLCRDRLRPGGMVVVNAGHPEGNDDLERVLTATLRSVFATVWRDPIEPTNTLLAATDAAGSGPRRLAAAVDAVPPGLRETAAAAASRVGSPLAGGKIYTDDLAPVEWLIDRSILRYAAETG